jgi:hypothetical protein
MSFKSRQRIKLAPGLFVNLDRGLPLISIDVKRCSTHLGKRGMRAPVSIPRDGLSCLVMPWNDARSPSNVIVFMADQRKHTSIELALEKGVVVMQICLLRFTRPGEPHGHPLH